MDWSHVAYELPSRRVTELKKEKGKENEEEDVISSEMTLEKREYTVR